MSGDAVCVWPAKALLGEGPVWSPSENAVYFTDIKGLAIHRYGLGGDVRSWASPQRISWLIPRENGTGFIAGAASGFAALTLEPFALAPFAHPEPDRPGNRFNDAKADPYGRLWAGTMDDREEADSGALYRLDPDHRWTPIEAGYRVPNGPAFSPDGQFLYHADSARRRVYRYRLEAGGAAVERTLFIAFEPDWGHPDGMACDCEGGLWIACWGGGAVRRFCPEGRLLAVRRTPASQTTSCVFAGPDLDRLFLTSAALGAPRAEPLAGGLFALDPGVRGAPVRGFAG